MLKKSYLFAIAAAAIVVMALATSSASAVTVSPAGNITASFGSGGITFATSTSTTLCPVVLDGNLNTDGTGSITNAIVNGGSHCLGIVRTYTFPWPVTITYGSPVAILRIANIQRIWDIGGLRCPYGGSLTLGIANPGGRINPPTGRLSDICGTAIIGGTGGTLSPTQTVTP